jgi:hypothetical protein
VTGRAGLQIWATESPFDAGDNSARGINISDAERGELHVVRKLKTVNV